MLDSGRWERRQVPAAPHPSSSCWHASRIHSLEYGGWMRGLEDALEALWDEIWDETWGEALVRDAGPWRG